MASPEGNAGINPARGRDAFRCPRCDAFAHQGWSELQIPREDERDTWAENFFDTSEPIPASKAATVPGTLPNVWGIEGAPVHRPKGSWAAAQCGRCGNYSVWRDDQLVFPHGGGGPAPHPEMSAGAKALYEEARSVVTLSPRAGAALARATLERVIRDLDPDAGKIDLASRIDRIRPQVSLPLGKMLTVIRHAGNKSLHVEDEPDEVIVLILDPQQTEIVDLIFESINGLVEELVARPRFIDEVYSRVPKPIRDAAERELKASEGP